MFDSLVAYRYPDNDGIRCFEGELRQGLSKGFVISQFISKKECFQTIADLKQISAEELDKRIYDLLSTEDYSDAESNIPVESTAEKDYFYEVNSIIDELGDNPQEKTIACRQIVSFGKLDVIKTFNTLCDKYPDAFVFLFCAPSSGAWIGASPELLLQADNSILSSYALAGTRPYAAGIEWDDKNIKEHRIVADYIFNKFKSIGIKPESTSIMSRRAGNVEHLFKRIWGNLENMDKKFLLDDLLEDLSPTPALCGMPKKESMERINRLEKFKRRFYGGFCGIYEDCNKFSFYVNLRSLCFDNTHCCIYAGGGITCQSDPGMEWNETASKAAGIQSSLCFC